MITRRRVNTITSESGFRADSVEKVLRLCAILRRLDGRSVTRGAWLLKGGTAINLLHLDVPRLSVDIDLNFVGAVEREGMIAARPGFEAALVAACEREGCTVKRAPGEHAGGKFRLRFTSVLGGSQNLEVDVSYVARVPLLTPERLPTRFPSDDPVDVPTLNLLELAAGKFTALVQRSAVRDAFDAANLLQLVPDLLEDADFRLAFVCSMAGGRHDPRELKPGDPLPDAAVVSQQLIPMLQVGSSGSAPDPEQVSERIREQLTGVVDRLLHWSERERAFLDRLHDEGVVEAALLHPDPAVRERIRNQPMLQWKAQNVRNHGRGR